MLGVLRAATIIGERGSHRNASSPPLPPLTHSLCPTIIPSDKGANYVPHAARRKIPGAEGLCRLFPRSVPRSIAPCGFRICPPGNKCLSEQVGQRVCELEAIRFHSRPTSPSKAPEPFVLGERSMGEAGYGVVDRSDMSRRVSGCGKSDQIFRRLGTPCFDTSPSRAPSEKKP